MISWWWWRLRRAWCVAVRGLPEWWDPGRTHLAWRGPPMALEGEGEEIQYVSNQYLSRWPSPGLDYSRERFIHSVEDVRKLTLDPYVGEAAKLWLKLHRRGKVGKGVPDKRSRIPTPPGLDSFVYRYTVGARNAN